MKKFSDWIEVKERLHCKVTETPRVSEGQIWWASLGENVGAEINGKSRLFTRPVLIYRKLARGFYLVIPMTTQVKFGTWYVDFWQQGKHVTVCLNQVRTIDYRRLFSRLGEIEPIDYGKIRRAFRKLYF